MILKTKWLNPIPQTWYCISNDGSYGVLLANSHLLTEGDPATKNSITRYRSKAKQYLLGIDVRKKHWTITVRHCGQVQMTFNMDPDQEKLA